MAKLKKNGRPTKYQSEYEEQVYKLCLLNATDVQIADFFEIGERTLDRWKRKYPQFRRSIKRGKAQADSEVAERLYHRAMGYSHKETKVFFHNGEIVTYEVVKHYPPETAAICFWLKNRQGWKDKAEVVVTDDRITTEERAKMRDILKARQSIKLFKRA